MRHLVLGTAGHIDHGKTTLVRALTGVDTDRLPDEKRRGITIDIGFAALPLGEFEVGIVDVPGHEAFVRNMLAGATGIDLVLLVVAADEGVMPQTREHLAIIRLLGIREAAVAITKADLVDDEWLELVKADITETLAATPLRDAAVTPVSARTGSGLDLLRDALHAAALRTRSRAGDDLFRMPVDRVFTIRGTGTVATGSVWSGTLQTGDTVRIMPDGLTARVRALQQHGNAVTEISAGARAAVALVGVEREQLARGCTLVTDDAWKAAGILTVDLKLLEDCDRPLRHRQRVRVHLGTAAVLGRVALHGGELQPGARALVQLRLEKPLTARAGDRLVLRDYSPVTTIAGGVVLEPDAPRRRRLDETTAAALTRLADTLQDETCDDVASCVTAAVTLRGVLHRLELPLATGLRPALLRAEWPDVYSAGDELMPLEAWQALERAALQQIENHHRERPLDDGPDRESLRRAVGATPGAFDRLIRDLVARRIVRTIGGAVALAGHEPRPGPALEAARRELLEVFEAAGLQPPETTALPPHLAGMPDLPAVLRFMERSGDLVRLPGGQWTATSAVASAADVLRLDVRAVQPLAVADFRDILGLTRKHLIPLLEYFDALGVTVRQGDVRTVSRPERPVEPAGPA